MVDIGANDGTLLAQYPAGPQYLRVAWEPVHRFYELVRPHASVVHPDFFHVRETWPLESKAHIVTAVAMFYDLEDPHAFLHAITQILHPDGWLFVQQAYLPAMLQATDYTNCCHEHLTYFDLLAMESLLPQHGLEVVDVEPRAINGGSFRVAIRFTGSDRRPSPRVLAFRAEEKAFFANRDQVYADFAVRVASARTQLQAVLEAYQTVGGPVDLYAASTKAGTLLQYCGIDRTVIRQAWERSPEKWGRVVGVTGIPIVSEGDGRKDPPAALMIGAWQFKDAFVARERDYLAAGGKMIFPLPFVDVVAQG